MRATLTIERSISRYNRNARSYGKKVTGKELTKVEEPEPEKPMHFVDKLVSFIKTWTTQLHAQDQANPWPHEGQQMSETKRIEIKQKHNETKPEIKQIPTMVKAFEDFYPAAQQSHIPIAPAAGRKVDQNMEQSQPIQMGAIHIKEKSMPPLEPKKNKFEHQYPVMPLQQTLDRYLTSLRPLLNKKAFQREFELTKDFQNNVGGELQTLLEAAGRDNVNWLTSRWTKVKYLRHRAPLAVFSSPCLAFPQQQFRNNIHCLDFTARTIYAMCEFKQLVDNDRIPQLTMNGIELDNSQFKNVFGTVRLPLRGCDALQQWNSNYVVVIHRNNFYKLPVYTEEKFVHSVDQIREQLVKVIRSDRKKGPAIGLLSQDERDNWAEANEMLARKELSAEALKCIEKALFSVSLDESVDVPANQMRSVAATQLLHGGGPQMNSANRWMDKTLQLIVNPLGIVGFCLEHTPAELQPAVTLMDYVLKNITKPNYGKSPFPVDEYEQVKHIPFAEVDECVGFWMRAAKRNISRITSHLQVHVFKFDSYGSGLLKSLALAPDSYIQMALQLAFYKQHKHLPAQQESAHLRIFKGGRSEVIRSASIESLKFVRAMVMQTGSRRSRLLALAAAVNGHREQTKQALQGHAVDCHFFGLQQMAQEHNIPLPEFFQSEGYLKSKNFRIVSSPLRTPHDAFLACGPPSTLGYGCCYNLREGDITFAIAAWKEKPKVCAETFAVHIQSALADMGQLVLGAGTSSRPTASGDR